MNLYNTPKHFCVNVFYSSQNCLSKEVAEILFLKLSKHNKVKLNSLNQYDTKNINIGDMFFFCISIENETENNMFIKKLNDTYFVNVQYSIMTIGNSLINQEIHILSNRINNALLRNKAICVHRFYLDENINGDNSIDDYIQNSCDFLVKYKNNLFKWFISRISDTPQTKLE